MHLSPITFSRGAISITVYLRPGHQSSSYIAFSTAGFCLWEKRAYQAAIHRDDLLRTKTIGDIPVRGISVAVSSS